MYISIRTTASFHFDYLENFTFKTCCCLAEKIVNIVYRFKQSKVLSSGLIQPTFNDEIIQVTKNGQEYYYDLTVILLNNI